MSNHPHNEHEPKHGTEHSGSGPHDDARRQLEAFRRQKDKFFRDSAESPLLSEDKEAFQNLNYYPIDHDYRVTALLISEEHPGTFKVQTTTGDFKEYTRLGRLEFPLGGQTYSLTAFMPPADEPLHGNRIFVPFRDKTSSQETYGAGRYLDLNKKAGSEYVLDFNRAYNPFCAYSPYYSCPLPPVENNLPVEILAGEKMFHE